MSKLPVPFGNPATYKGHSGVDFPQARGVVFRASGPGRVVSRGRNDRGGFFVWVQYDGGPLVGYHHMDSHAGVPALGSRVAEGTPLGFVGSLGQFSTGPHLHSEVSGHATTDGYWRFFDPSRVVGQGQAAGGGSAPLPSPTLTILKEDDDMIPIYITDDCDGNGRPGWALFNTRTGNWVPQVNDGSAKAQEIANSWGRVLGRNATKCTRQDALNVAAGIRATS